MTSSVTRSAVASMTPLDRSIGDRSEELLDLATSWLSAEVASVRQPGRIQLVTKAMERASAYEGALAAASPEEIRLAWQQAVARQARNEVGSVRWTTAGRVSELLRYEEVAARETPTR